MPLHLSVQKLASGYPDARHWPAFQDWLGRQRYGWEGIFEINELIPARTRTAIKGLTGCSV